MAARDRGDLGWRERFVPPRLTTRLIYTMMAAAAIVFVAIATLVSFLIAYYTRSLVTADARNQLTQVQMGFDQQGRELDALVMAFTEWTAFYDQTSALDPAFVAAEFDPWLADRTDAVALVWARSDGSIISSSGSAADVDALLAAATGPAAGRYGAIVLPSGPAVIATRPIVGDPARPPVGTLAVAHAIGSGSISLSAADIRIVDVSDTAIPPAEGWRPLPAPVGYEWIAGEIRGTDWVTRAALKTIDGRYFLIEVVQPDPYIGEGRLGLVIAVPVGLGLLTIAVGVLIGLVVSRSVGRPLQRFVSYMQDQGYLALQGLRADEDLFIDPGLPEDFRELGQVILDLMTQLRINQAELIEAGEQALTAERAFRTVVEESPEVKILVREGVVEIANPAAAHFFGLHLGDLVKADPQGLFAGIGLYDEEGVRLDLPSVAEKALTGPVVVRCTAPNQPDRWIEMSVAVMDPALLDYVISARNVTEERRLEALREEILSLVSHDLRSPLTVVRGYVDMLERPLDDERRTTAAEAARKAAERMEGLLDDLLHATRAERVFAPTVMRMVDLSALSHNVASSLQMGAEQDIRVTADVEVIVLGDEVRLEQALTNLIGNAIKHGPEDGEIRVAVSADDDRARVTIEDDGPGIPDDLRETVFQRGARGRAASGKPGLGLGLYIVRVVAEAHGGSAYIEETAGGTRFVLELPLEETGAGA